MLKEKDLKRRRLEDQLLREMNTIFRGLSDVRFNFVSVTKVELNADYSVATFYWDTYNEEKRGTIKRAIEKISPKVRSILSSTLKIRSVPQIEFKYDGQFDAENKITKILNSEASKKFSDSEEN